VVYRNFRCVESGEENEEEDDGFEGTPRPMLPYSSMYIFGPTNPYVLSPLTIAAGIGLIQRSYRASIRAKLFHSAELCRFFSILLLLNKLRFFRAF